MKSLLIVEDEKMIRQGIVTMAKRAPVEIGEILECRNGEEALNLLRSRQVDAMFTDIRMPKMDGITLLGHLKELAHPPRTVVVSGYDDFSYAVEALRGGAQDYILKPIERDKVFAILQKIDDELEEEKKEHNARKDFGRQQLRYLINNSEVPKQEMLYLEQQFDNEAVYRICCSSIAHPLDTEEGLLQLEDMEGQSVFLIPEEYTEKFAERYLPEYCVGISAAHQGLREIHTAYAEALKARKEAFVTGKPVAAWKKEKAEQSRTEIAGDFAERFVQMIGTDKADNAWRQMENYYFQARRGNLDAEMLLKVFSDILLQVPKVYRNVLAADKSDTEKLRLPLSYNNAEAFLAQFKDWIWQIRSTIEQEFSDYRNKEKINMAVAYINENYGKELNMAVVSNHISMNYSLFSLSFKQYTGMNFVNYLKMIRIREAKRLLEETEEKIIDISQKVGYENEKHFMKTFKSVCGVSPSEYRKNVWMGKTEN